MEKQNKDSSFKPYIPPEKTQPELTVASIVIGVVLSVVFGAANAYLGLRVGMTVSASIPAAVISMVVMRVILRRNSILESNLVQTIGSAGESLAGGAIFTMPVFFLWWAEGQTEAPNLLTLSILAICGGVLGVLFMIPLRNALIVKEHGVLPYPEGTACAEVLLAGEARNSGGKSIFAGMGIAAACKFLTDGLAVIPNTIAAEIRALKTEVAAEVYPALIGVGYICGPKISSYMLAGGVLGWFVLIPAIVTFGGDTILYPATTPISELYENGGATLIWSTYLRYIGAGMVAAGGLFSLVKSLPSIFKAFAGSVRGMKSAGPASGLRTERDLDLRLVLGVILVILVVLVVLPQVPISIPGALMILFFGFFFGAVSARIVGIVGSSNTPVSGMTIAVMLLTTLILKAIGVSGTVGMVSALSVGAVVCIVMAIAGDTSQDLKTGFLLGATPRKQQIGEIVGVLAAAVAIGGIMILLNSAWGFGSAELAAPQATLMKMLIEGVMSGNLPWSMILIGAFLAVVVEMLGIPVLPVAIGLYLPVELSVTIMIGGVIRWILDRKMRKQGRKEGSGILFCSGMIAGEGLVGILLAVLAVAGVSDKIVLPVNLGWIGGIALLAVIAAATFWFGRGDGKESPIAKKD
jgi:putative OPT family oligopeptide transporter